jgi:hypothetical protein
MPCLGWSGGALLEEATLAREARTRERTLEPQADQIWTWMRETAGLVEPEPRTRAAAS